MSLHAFALPRCLDAGIHRLYIPALERSSLLRQDLKHLSQRFHLCLAEVPSLHSSSQNPADFEHSGTVEGRLRLSEFVTYISVMIEAKPHVLLAYTWIFYMAFFSGGRYIRGKLSCVQDDGFWVREITAMPADGNVMGSSPLSFWGFSAASHDGEDLKTEFKARFRDVESGLSLSQRMDVIQEAVEIMTRLMEIIREIEVSLREENEQQIQKVLVISINSSTT